MPYHDIDHEITSAQMQQMENHFNKLLDALSWGVNLTAEERRAMQSVSAGRSQFLDKVYETHAPNHPKLQPAFGDLAASTRDYTLYKDLGQLEALARRVLEVINDTRHAAGHEAYEYARDFYQMSKQAKDRNVPGAESVYDDLSAMYEANGNRYNPAEDNEPIPMNTPGMETPNPSEERMA